MKTKTNNWTHTLGRLRRMSVMVVLLCIGSVAAFAQKNVRGSVSDEKGEPLAGVSVLTEYNGKKTGTVTDANGNWSLTVQNGADV